MEKLYFNFVNDMFNSATAKANKINNTTSDPKILTNLLNLIWYCLNIIRVMAGIPIYVECAFRCPALQTLLGGENSERGHNAGCCADLSTNGKWTQEKLFYFIYDLFKKGVIEYDQLILEKNKDGDCVHIGFCLGNNRRQTMVRTIDKNGKFVYTNV